MLFFIGFVTSGCMRLPQSAWPPTEGHLRTLWGKPDFGLCCYGQHPCWCGETSGLTHSLRLQHWSSPDHLCPLWPFICIRHKKAPRLRFSWGISAVLGILHLASGVGSMSGSKQRALDDIISHWKQMLHHWSHAAWTRIRIGPVWKFIPLNFQFLSLVNNLGIYWLISFNLLRR